MSRKFPADHSCQPGRIRVPANYEVAIRALTMPEPTLNETMREYAEEMVKLARKNFRIVSFIVKLFDANDALVPLEPAERKTLRAENLGKEETRALTGVDGTSPLVLGLFPQNVARFQIVLDLENTREARRRFAPRIEGR